MHIFMVIAITMPKYMQYMSAKRLVQLVKKIIQIFNIQPLHFAGKEAEIYILGFSCPQLLLIKLHRKIMRIFFHGDFGNPKSLKAALVTF